MQSKFRYLVTGGGGFLGKALVTSLCKDGHEVYSLSRGSYPELEKLGATCIACDLSQFNPEKYAKYFEGIDGVFHVASKVGMWGPYNEFYAANVLGTDHLLEYCRRAEVRNFVFTSSPSVIANGKDLRGVDETIAYPMQYHAPYPATKAIAERLVLRAVRDKFRAVSLRPHLIFGPNDTSLIPTIIRKAESGKLKVIGGGENRVDFTFIDDCVQAHRKAMHALQDGSLKGGKSYFITQDEPVKFWDFVNEILRKNNVPEINSKVPFALAYVLAAIAEGLSLCTGKEPLLSRFLVEELATDHYFNIEAAKSDFGYQPAHSMEEALEKTFGEVA